MTVYTFRYRKRGKEPTLVVVLADDIDRAARAASNYGKGRKQIGVDAKPINGTTIGVPVILHKSSGGKLL